MKEREQLARAWRGGSDDRPIDAYILSSQDHTELSICTATLEQMGMGVMFRGYDPVKEKGVTNHQISHADDKGGNWVVIIPLSDDYTINVWQHTHLVIKDRAMVHAHIPTLTKQSTLLHLNKGQVLIFHPNLCHSGGVSSKKPLPRDHPLRTMPFQVFPRSKSNDHITDVSMHYSVVNEFMNVGVGADSIRDEPELMLIHFADDNDVEFENKKVVYGKLIFEAKEHLNQMIYGTHPSSFVPIENTIHATNLLDIQSGDKRIFHPIAAARQMMEQYKNGKYKNCKYISHRNDKN